MRFLLIAFLASFVVSVHGQTVVWKYSTDNGIYSSPCVGDGVIYFGSSDMHVYALDKYTGRLKWKFKTNGAVNATPVLDVNKVIVNSADGYVYAMNKDNGNILWKFKTKGEQRYDLWDYYLSSPVIDNHIVYIGSGDSSVY